MRENVYGPEFGERLRQIRHAAGLTRVDLGARIGVSENHLWRLEDGRMKRPDLDLIARFLQACGTRWSAIIDLLEQVNTPAPDTQQVDKSLLTERDRDRLASAVTRQARKYAREAAYPLRGRPPKPGKLDQTVSRFGRYRVVAGLVEHAVTGLLRSNGMFGYELGKYRAFARHELGRQWRQAADDAGERPKSGSRGPDSKAKAGRDDEFWVRQGLDPGLMAQVREVVAERFGQMAGKGALQTSEPEAPGRAPKPPGAAEKANRNRVSRR